VIGLTAGEGFLVVTFTRIIVVKGKINNSLVAEIV